MPPSGGHVFDGPEPGGGKFVFDGSTAILIEQIDVAIARITAAPSGPEPAPDPREARRPSKVALVIGGKIARGEEPVPVSVLGLTDWDGVATLITELYALAKREGIDLSDALTERWAELQRQGVTPPREGLEP